MPTDAEIRRRKKQDATRKRVAIWLSPDVAARLDALRGETPRNVFVAEMIEKNTQGG
jgi:predicted DNA-binding protein